MRRATLVAALALAGCSLGAPRPLPLAPASATLPDITSGAGKIEHVVYIVQENRSFDAMFQGYPGADTVSSGKNSRGQTIALRPVSLKKKYEILHGADAMFAACDGTGKLPGTQCRMDGFDKEGAEGGPPNPEYVYVPHDESKPYFDIAHEFVLADRMFQSQLDESFVAHQYIIAARAQASVDVPLLQWGCGGGPADTVRTLTHERTYAGPQQACFDYNTLGDELDAAGLPWRFYTSRYTIPDSGFWSGYQAVKHIFDGPDWAKDVITPQKQFLTDIAAGKLASFTWITPLCKDSDHVSCGGGYGPSWVASLVNAIGESKFWNHTVVFVQWDDWGGTYDHVRPHYKGFDGTGFRVPLIVISPYAKENYVSHVEYETTSVLRYAEDLFGLGQLSEADARATSPAADCLDFTQKPRKFVPIKAPYSRDFFLHESGDERIPDEE
ncbi:MAG TPA: alkaline phosphatase family protein [Candidatus Binatia bacterium]|nr:alkaline phosphatase family protein [Candidatus Binatia bacterium]